MTWQERIIAAHKFLDVVLVYRYRALKPSSDRWFVWQEERGEDLIAEGAHAERVVRGTTDFFTKTEDDPWAGLFEQSLTDNGIAWYWNSTQFEETTGIIHHEWVWEIVDRPNEPEPEPDPEPEPEPEPEPDPEPDPEQDPEAETEEAGNG